MNTVYAPGKLVLIGEYAVLDGAPAIVVAVDRGVSCTFEPNPRLEIETPGSDDRYVRHALQYLGATGRYQFAAYNAPTTATKAGLGGSAAAVVAALYAGHTLLGRTPAAPVLTALGRKLHQEVQGGGSGIDVAASAWGGLLRFQDGEVFPLQADLTFVVVFSGQSAETGPRVRQYLQWTERELFLATSTHLAQNFLDDPVGTTRAARQLLGEMARASGIAWMTPALSRICDLAEAHGGAAKPSGAGGGDCAVALVPDATAFTKACVSAGFTVIPTTIAPGASVREVPSSPTDP